MVNIQKKIRSTYQLLRSIQQFKVLDCCIPKKKKTMDDNERTIDTLNKIYIYIYIYILSKLKQRLTHTIW